MEKETIAALGVGAGIAISAFLIGKTFIEEAAGGKEKTTLSARILVDPGPPPVLAVSHTAPCDEPVHVFAFLTDSPGLPLAGYPVELHHGGAVISTVTTDADGKATVILMEDCASMTENVEFKGYFHFGGSYTYEACNSNEISVLFVKK